MEWYLKVIKNYANFNGRARRKEYWMFVLFNIIVTLLLYALVFVGAAIEAPGLGMFGLVLVGLYALFTLIPGLAVVVRRLHDIGKSGAYIFVYFIPIAGPIWLLVMLCTDSQAGDNMYGTNPKTGGGTEDHLVNEETA